MEETKTTTCPTTGIKLTESQIEVLVDCGALQYGPDMISNLLGISFEDAERVLDNSCFLKHYNRGEALANYRIESKLLELATQGDTSAMKELRSIQATRSRKAKNTPRAHAKRTNDDAQLF